MRHCSVLLYPIYCPSVKDFWGVAHHDIACLQTRRRTSVDTGPSSKIGEERLSCESSLYGMASMMSARLSLLVLIQ